MKEKYIKNSILLFVCLLITKFIGAVYKIPLSNILGTNGIGIYQMIYYVYSLFLVFITGAIPTFVAQRISYYRAKNENAEISKLIKCAYIFAITLGIFFTIAIILLSKVFSNLQGISDAYLGYVIVGTSITFSAVSSVAKGYFFGYEYMLPSAISGIVEQCAKLVLGLTFASIFTKYNTNFAVFGAFFGGFVSEFVAFVFMLIFFIKKKQTQKVKVHFASIKKFGVNLMPLVATNIVVPFSNFLDSFLVVNLLNYHFENKISTSLFGIATGMIAPIVNFPVLLCGTICTAILPSLSYKIANNENISKNCNNILFFVFLIFVPCAFGLMALSENIINIFFPSIEQQFHNVSIFYLKIASVSIIWQTLLQITNSILYGFGKFRLTLTSEIIGITLKIITLILLILFTNLNILSLALAINVGYFSSLIICLCYAKKYVQLNNSLKKLSFCLLSSIIMFLIVGICNFYIIINPMLKLVILLIIGVLAYFTLCFVFNVITFGEIKNALKNIKLGNKNWKEQNFCV